MGRSAGAGGPSGRLRVILSDPNEDPRIRAASRSPPAAVVGLLEETIAPAELWADLRAVQGVAPVEDLHVWQVCSRLTVRTVRLRDTAGSLAERRAVRSRVHAQLAAHGVDHATAELVDASDRDTTPQVGAGHDHGP